MTDRSPVRLSLVHMLPAVLDRHGVGHAPVLARGGVAAASDWSRQIVARAQICAILTEAARRTGDAGIGFDLATAADPAALGVSGHALFGGETLGDCLAAHARHMPGLQGGVELALEVANGRAVWRHRFIDSDHGAARVLNEGITGFMLAALRAILGPDAGDDFVVAFPHRPAASTRAYEERLRAGVVFGRGDGNEIAFDAALLALPNRARAAAAVPSAEAAATGPDFSDAAVVARIEPMIGSMLLAGEATLVRAARGLGLAPRSLQRSLARSGTSFEELVEAERRRRAVFWLGDGALPIGSVARALGYAHPAHFTRAFRRWHGMPPADYRRGLLAGQILPGG